MFNQYASPFLRSRASTANLIKEDLPEKPKRTLNTIQLLCVTFFCVSGGGYGLEQAVHHGYPLFTLLALIIVPWFWSLPSALMTAELSSAIPENGGFILWIKKGLGSFWAFQAGWWSWIYTLVDNALYPVMFVDYLSHFTGPIESNEVKLVIRIGVILFISIINLWGIEIVGLLAIVFTVLVLSPFLFLVFWGLGEVNASCLTETHHPATNFNWGIFLSVILWNTAGWDNASTVAGEINNPQTTYPRALLGAVVLVMTSYILPLSAAVCVNNDFEKWEVGYYPQILGQEFGKGMEYMSTFSALVASIGLFNVIMCTSSRVLASFAADDMAGIGKLGALHSDFKTPYVAIVINAIGITIFSFLPFESLIQLDISMYGLSLILKFLSLIFLRFREPLLNRPYRIPLGRMTLVLFVLPPICLAFTSFMLTSSTTKIISVIVILVGLLLYALCFWKNNRNLAFQTHKNYYELEDQFSVNVSDDSDSDSDSRKSPRTQPKDYKPD